ncbi:MAG: hypothetical protein KF788_00540 [Piscinibacter sp.]|nr:hypothetical protein [Piscinibacter sp.]
MALSTPLPVSGTFGAPRTGATFGQRVWTALTSLGRHRGRRELLRLAEHYGLSDPALARQLRDAARSDWL